MNKKYFGIAIIAISIILILGMIYIFFFYHFQSPPETNQTPAQNQLPSSQNTTANPASTNPPLTTPTPRVRKESMSQDDLKRMAGSFAERFGSYSNQSDFSNVEDLKIFMTDSMKDWAQKFINESISHGGNRSIYYGITTSAITEEMKSFDDDGGTAQVLVKTQRREATGTMNNASAFYQDILINFVKEGGAWKVNSAYWQTK